MPDGCGPNCGSEHDHTISEDRGVLYSLYKQIDLEKVTCLNEAVDGSGKTVFKPWEGRLDRSKFVQSNADPELLFNIPFTDVVRLKGIILLGGEEGNHPARMRLFKDRPGMRFEDTSIEPDQSFDLARDESGTLEYILKASKFLSLSHRSIHIRGNMAAANAGEIATKVYYIGLRGEDASYLRHLREFLEGRSRWSVPVKPTQLRDTLTPGWRTATVKRKTLTEFSPAAFVEAIVSNTIEVQRNRMNSGDLAALLAALTQISEAEDGDGAREVALTILVHMAKTVSAASLRHRSHIKWLLETVVLADFFDAARTLVSLPVVATRAKERVVRRLWEDTHLKRNIAFLLWKTPLPSGLSKDRWNFEEILACLERMELSCWYLPRKYLGFTMLRGVSVNLTVKVSDTPEVDAAVWQTLHYARTLFHESAHFSRRSLCLPSFDLNYPTPPKRTVANTDTPSTSAESTSFGQNVRRRFASVLNRFGDAAAAASYSDLAESGFQAEISSFGGVFTWNQIEKPQEERMLGEVGEHIIRTLVESDLSQMWPDPDAVLEPGAAIFGQAPNGRQMLEFLKRSCVNMTASELKANGTFGVLYSPEPEFRQRPI